MAERRQVKLMDRGSLPPDTVYVGHGSTWQNPFTKNGMTRFHKALHGHDPLTVEERAKQNVWLFAMWMGFGEHNSYDEATHRRLAKWKELISETKIKDLRGKNLACTCPLTNPDGSKHPCHADVLLEIANQFESDDDIHRLAKDLARKYVVHNKALE